MEIVQEFINGFDWHTLIKTGLRVLAILFFAWIATRILKQVLQRLEIILTEDSNLTVGFGAQNLVRDFISGFYSILENQIRVGDVAIINGTGGLVEKINFRTIVQRDLAGVVHIFSNGNITSMSNATNEWSADVFDVGIAYKESTERSSRSCARSARRSVTTTSSAG